MFGSRMNQQRLKGKWKGRAALLRLSKGTAETEGSAQLAELQAAVLPAERGASTIYTGFYAVWAGATQWLLYWEAEG